MLSITAAVTAGSAAGAAHVVSGPDHLAALAPLSVHSPRRAMRAGAAWGLGHGAGVVVLGGLGQLARDLIDIQRVSAFSEVLVGFLLLGIGLWALRRASTLAVHTHDHTHDGSTHHHLHIHASSTEHEDHSHAAFWVGALHGTAGGGHLLGVLPSLALPPAPAAAYLLAYLIAAVASMTAFSALIGRLTGQGGPRRLRRILQGSAAASVVIGVAWIGIGLTA
jgi:sulfite exporter TauE/SafE